MISPKPNKAFTLIELLTVIAIIAVLMGLLFPAISAVKESARKTQAKNDELQIANSIKAFYTEYGKYPDPTLTGTADYQVIPTADNSKVIDVLRNNTQGSNNTIVTSLNPRQIVFLEAPLANGYGTTNEKSGIGSSTGGKLGQYLDPWGTPYGIAFDGNYDNQLNATASPLATFYTDTNFKPLNTGVIVWSYGKDKKLGNNGTPTYNGSDDVISWQ